MLEEYGLLSRRKSGAKVDVAPLLDMVFILLIFFVITSNFNRQTGVDVQKPKSQSALYQGQQTVMVGITREGTVHIHGRQVSIEALTQILSQELARRPDMQVVIVGDKGSPLGRTVEVMDLCTQSGIAKVSLAADKQ
jgi:biopolymer transport protein ExbD